jgi:hypothetical protein
MDPCCILLPAVSLLEVPNTPEMSETFSHRSRTNNTSIRKTSGYSMYGAMAAGD